MPKGNLLALATVATVAISRGVLFFLPIESPTIEGFRLHHYMYGLVLLPIGIALGSPVLCGVATGLILDEATFLALGGQTHADNFSAPSVVGTVVLTTVSVVLRQALARAYRLIPR